MSETHADAEPLLAVNGLTKHFTQRGGLFGEQKLVRAVDGLSFDLHEGETLGLVGESGCGKSTLARTLMCLTPATGGSVRYRGAEILTFDSRQMRNLRRDIQVVFQDPYSSLSPRMSVRQIIFEPWEVHPGIVPKQDRERRLQELLEQVGLPAESSGRYPHEFSGGQRQRIGIARALAMDPALLIADEAVSALDVSVQSQVLALLDDIKKKMDLAMLFVTHDLRVAAQICDKTAVMKLGEIVEYGNTYDLFHNPQHAYTKSLLAAVPGKNWTVPNLSIA